MNNTNAILAAMLAVGVFGSLPLIAEAGAPRNNCTMVTEDDHGRPHQICKWNGPKTNDHSSQNGSQPSPPPISPAQQQQQQQQQAQQNAQATANLINLFRGMIHK